MNESPKWRGRKRKGGGNPVRNSIPMLCQHIIELVPEKLNFVFLYWRVLKSRNVDIWFASVSSYFSLLLFGKSEHVSANLGFFLVTAESVLFLGIALANNGFVASEIFLWRFFIPLKTKIEQSLKPSQSFSSKHLCPCKSSRDRIRISKIVGVFPSLNDIV